jgi:C1A family cysteine protease
MFSTWFKNDKYIDEVNAKNLTYSLGHNEYSGMNIEEFREHFSIGSHKKIFDINPKKIKKDVDEVKCILGCLRDEEQNKKIEKIRCVSSCINNEDLTGVSSSVDWVSKGAVTPVKNQGQCGSCWSFSTTGALEGAYFIKTGKLDSFSEQQLVDCDNLKNGGKDHGCNGGLMDNAFNWIKSNDGLCSEKDYPYVSGTTKKAGSCDSTCLTVPDSDVTGYIDVSPNSDSNMMSALEKQPVSIAIQADQKDFQLYKSGTFTGDCGTNLDHGVLLVGYGNDGDDYYLVKNSWGTTWGDNGYIKLGRGEQYNSGKGQCGLLMQGSYPLL